MTDRIPLYVTATGTPSRAEDGGVPGSYLVEIDADLDPKDRASAALDIFHEYIGIRCLDDFAITVRDDEGREIAERDDTESYRLGSRGAFCGAIDPADLPQARRNQPG
jgi:hypothetical protein